MVVSLLYRTAPGVVILVLSPVVPTGNPNAPAVWILTNFVVPGAILIFAVESIDDIVLPLNLIPPALVTLMFAPGIGCKLPRYVF